MRRRLLAVLALAAATLVALTAAAAAQAAGGTITGTVTGASSHAPLESVEVCALVNGNGFGEAHCASTGSDGRYAIAGLPAGSYEVRFAPGYADSTHVQQFYPAKASRADAEPVSVSEGGTTAGIDAELAVGGELSGRVGAAGGGPLEGIGVCAEPVHFELGTHRCVSTEAGGEYAITGLGEDGYVIHFSGGPDYVDQYYDGKATHLEAGHVQVEYSGSVSGIDAELTPAGKIAGQVTEVGSGVDLAGVRVCATPSVLPDGLAAHCANTDSSGSYTIGGLAAGTYDVRFGPGATYLVQYFAGAENQEEAHPVTVTQGSTTGSVDAAMQPGGRITGTVTAASDHSPLQGILVCLNVENAHSSTCISSGADGSYAFSGLRGGNYTVGFSTQAPTRGYVDQLYSGKATHKTADPVAVTVGQTTAGIDAAMQTGGTIAGVVTDAVTHEPIEGVSVCADFHGSCVTTDAAGVYEIQGLPTGSYRVRFDPGAAARYLRQYFDGKATLAEAEPVAVTAGETTGGVDAAMVEGESISGTVTDAADGAAAPLVRVCARNAANGRIDRCDQTDTEGRYAIVGLAAGEYVVRFSPGYLSGSVGTPNRNYVAQYFDGKATLAEAEPVTVRKGAGSAGIDAAMHEGGKVSGRVTAASGGTPVVSAEVCAHVGSKPDGEHCASTGVDGEYVLEGLATGSYTISFGPTFYPFAPSNYAPQIAEGVSVAAEATHEHVDAALPTGGQISGHVTDASTGQGIGGVTVCAWQSGREEEEGEGAVPCGSTNSHGDYTVSRLATGSYKVEFSDLLYPYEDEEDPLGSGEPTAEETYVRQFWNAGAGAGSAAAVAVTEGSTTGGIDASLVPVGGTSGAVGSEEAGGGGSGESTGGDGGPSAAAPSGATSAGGVPTGRSLARKVRRHLKCRKGFAKKKVKGKVRCVRKRHRKHRKHHPHRRHRKHRGGAHRSTSPLGERLLSQVGKSNLDMPGRRPGPSAD